MKLNEQIGMLIREVENARYPEDKDAYRRICEHISELKKKAESLYNLTELLKQLDNVQYMMHCYLPKKGYSDTYGSPHKTDDERSYNNLAREKKRLIATMYKLKTSVEGLQQ